MDLRATYDAILELQAELAADHDDPVFCRPDFRKVKALAATYELQEYLSGLIQREDVE